MKLSPSKWRYLVGPEMADSNFNKPREAHILLLLLFVMFFNQGKIVYFVLLILRMGMSF